MPFVCEKHGPARWDWVTSCQQCHEEEAQRERDLVIQLLGSRGLDELPLTKRMDNCFRYFEGISLLGELVSLTEAEVLRIPNFGRKSLNELNVMLAAKGLRLGMTSESFLEQNAPPEPETTVQPSPLERIAVVLERMADIISMREKL